MLIHSLLPTDEYSHTKYAQKHRTARQDLRESVVNNRGNEKERTEERVIAPAIGGAVHVEVLLSRYDSLRQSVKLAFPKKDNEVCVFTDAYEEFWAGIVLQTSKNQLQQMMQTQKHEPMAFVGGKFVGAQRNETTYEKEGYAIAQTFKRMIYWLWGTLIVILFTD